MKTLHSSVLHLEAWSSVEGWYNGREHTAGAGWQLHDQVHQVHHQSDLPRFDLVMQVVLDRSAFKAKQRQAPSSLMKEWWPFVSPECDTSHSWHSTNTLASS